MTDASPEEVIVRALAAKRRYSLKHSDLETAECVLNAFSEAGRVIAPAVASRAMIEAGRATEFADGSISCADAYAAMIAASQEGKK